MSDSKDSLTLHECGEEALVARLLQLLPQGPDVIAGPGDDCAVVEHAGGEWELLKTDCVVEGIHFDPKTDSAAAGRKAMNRVLSDFAAMAGVPRYALVTLACDGERPMSQIEGWYRGMREAADEYDCSIVGGETTRIPYVGSMLSIAMTGFVEPGHCIFRSGAKVGDRIVVTGKLGGSFESGRHLSFRPRIAEARWLAAHGKPTAMMDLSDGLGSDLPRLAAASGVGFHVDFGAIPCHDGVSTEGAVADGEDYELLFTIAPDLYAKVEYEWKNSFPGLELTAIGTVTEEAETPLGHGWEHFREE